MARDVASGERLSRRRNTDTSKAILYTNSIPCLTTQSFSSSQGTSKKSGEKDNGSSATNQSVPDPLATALLRVLAAVLQCFATASPEEKEVATLVQRMVDLIG